MSVEIWVNLFIVGFVLAMLVFVTWQMAYSMAYPTRRYTLPTDDFGKWFDHQEKRLFRSLRCDDEG